MKEAEEMYMRALKGYEKARGPNHSSTVGTAHRLSKVYRNQARAAYIWETRIRSRLTPEIKVGQHDPAKRFLPMLILL
jgi:hypothetical protein